MIRAVIFGLDGVLVATDECRYQAWKEMTQEQGIPFDRDVYERLRGQSSMDRLNALLKKAKRPYSEAEKMALSMRENDLYAELVGQLDGKSILPGATETARALQAAGIKTAVGSSGKDAAVILRQLKIDKLFDVVIDAGQIAGLQPEMEVFLRAADKLMVTPASCLVVADKIAGAEAAAQCGMTVWGVGKAAHYPAAGKTANTLAELDFAGLIADRQSAIKGGFSC